MRHCQVAVVALLLLSAEVGALWAVFGGGPYTRAAPKKLFLQRTLRHGDGFLDPIPSWDAAAIDSVPAAAALPADAAAAAAPSAPGAWLALFPVSNVLQARRALAAAAPYRAARCSMHCNMHFTSQKVPRRARCLKSSTLVVCTAARVVANHLSAPWPPLCGRLWEYSWRFSGAVARADAPRRRARRA